MALTGTARPLAEKQARIRTIAALMRTHDNFEAILAHDMGDFSEEETGILNDVADMLEHWIRLTTAQT